jgi:organic hydroperoxide reductase OsmC/OhrA
MSVATELGQAGTPPTRIDTTVRIVMDEVAEEGHQIVGSEVTIRVNAESADEQAIAEAIERADGGCPFSTLLRKAGVRLSIDRA